MNCDVIQDLIPLYVDDCCSAASQKLIEEHLETCQKCNDCLKAMGKVPDPLEIPVPTKLNIRAASLLQVALYYLTFALLVWGVLKEGNTPLGDENGLWAFALIIPPTGFLLSLVNLYCIRMYRSRKSFALGSLVLTVLLTAICYLWGFLHYGKLVLFPGVFLAAVFCFASPLLSNLYGRLVGKQ